MKFPRCPQLVLLLAVSAAAPLHANNSADYYTWGPLERKSQGYWIHTNIPSGCRWAISTSAEKWTAAELDFTYVWKGYVNAQSWGWNGSDNISTTSNTMDTSVESGVTDRVDYLAQTEYRVRGYNSTTDRWLFYDADVIINYNYFSANAWCGTSPPPSNMMDFPSTAIHELGHVPGLDHDYDDLQNVTVLAPAGQMDGQMKRDLTARDVQRAVYLYGAP